MLPLAGAGRHPMVMATAVNVREGVVTMRQRLCTKVLAAPTVGEHVGDLIVQWTIRSLASDGADPAPTGGSAVLMLGGKLYRPSSLESEQVGHQVVRLPGEPTAAQVTGADW